LAKLQLQLPVMGKRTTKMLLVELIFSKVQSLTR